MNNIIKSKFTFWAIILPIFLIAITILIVTLFNEIVYLKKGNNGLWFVELLLTFTWSWLLFGELRTKAIGVKIQNGIITKTNIFGSTSYRFDNFDGFAISQVWSKAGNHEYLYLVKDNEKIIKISEFYHRNYLELKKTIIVDSVDLGEIHYNIIDDVKEIFK